MCQFCQDKRYVISERDDGRLAIERCDACSSTDSERPISDCDASLLARANGIRCETNYPHYLIGRKQ